MSPRTRSALTAIVVPVAVLAACGGDTREAPARVDRSQPELAEPAPAASMQAETMVAPRGKKLRSVRSQFGRILGDGRGQAIYVFDAEESSKPECYGPCATAWPPVLTRGKPVAGRGVRAVRLGTTRRRSGKRQVTINGRPLYYYVDDAPGRVLCHGVEEFGGLWLVVRADGSPVP